MADSEFEEFRRALDRLPFGGCTTLKTTSPFYSIVPNLEEDIISPSPECHSYGSNDSIDGKLAQTQAANEKLLNGLKSLQHSADDDDGLQMQAKKTEFSPNGTAHNSHTNLSETGPLERRRRKLPEIPKDKRSSMILSNISGQMSLADELSQHQFQQNHMGNQYQRTLLTRKCGYLLDEDSSPDSDRLHSLGDVDSGHSTAHSPIDLKSLSPQMVMSPSSQSQSLTTSTFGGLVSFSQLEMLEATHRGLHKFNPRHHDEVDIEIGDPIYVQKEADDLWCEGVNLRTGRQGIFPSAYAVDLEYNDFDPNAQKVKKERYLLGYMGSVETMAHKGTGVVCQAVRKIVGECGETPNVQLCILEISDQGLRMVERASANKDKQKRPTIDYFYSLKNVSFCAFHPRDHRYIGFITKHPTIQRFACHVFKGQESTRPVAEAVGRAFQRFYQKFIETAYPIEDIYIE